jgi:uroporphyrin-III C-methyltransferase/precorrin-2 dehydrogenase/sirohydrochlorin ferrochelatase
VAKIGTVTLVGAGPGDPDLLTVAALRVISSASVIYHDALVADEIVRLAKPDARLISVGKRGYRPSCKQSEINAEIIRIALQGTDVVRLKAGDPLIFGRAGEEIAACRDAGIPVRVIPGITSAQGAAAQLLISLTHRDAARRLQYITGHDRNGKLPHDLNWAAIADPSVTTVVYMPHKTLRELAVRAIAAGLDPATPAAAISNATRPNEMVLRSTVAQIADKLEAEPIGSPLLVLIGWVLDL